MKKKDIAATIGLTAVIFVLVAMLGGCARDLPLESVTQMGTEEGERESQRETQTDFAKEQESELQACTSENGENTQNPEQSTEPKLCSYPKADMQSCVMDFSAKLFQNSIQKEKNTLISPISVMMALSMTANGAKGETLAEMEEAFGNTVEALNFYFSGYQKSLLQEEAYQLHMANAIWVNNHDLFTVKEDFLKISETYYNACVQQSAFGKKTIKDINEWVTEHTGGKIKEILSEIRESSMMYLINALSFEAKWSNPYSERSVKTGEFTKEDGQKQSVSFMYSVEGGFLEDENTTGFVKYYEDGKFAFAAFLPKEGISMETYLKSFSAGKIMAMLDNPQRAIVHTAIPKFTSECTLDMKPILKNMGISRAFSAEEADLSGLGSYENGNTYIDSVAHKTYISVAEQGTEAGAVTVISDKATGAMPETESQQVYLNRPFVYVIIDSKEQLPLFMGTVMSIE
uniref:serpin family protein n=1 Tax=Agathobacter sp. TaxID=2021311 RepID=UPI004055D659